MIFLYFSFIVCVNCVGVFAQVLSESGIRPWTRDYMIKKANSMRSNAAFDQYLVNSKNYFEKNFATYEI